MPSARTVAKPLSRSTFRCWLTAGWLIPNSPPTRAATSPALVSPVGEQLEDAAADGVAEDVEGVHAQAGGSAPV